MSESEVARRLSLYGENRLPEEKKENLTLIFLKQFQSPLIYVLLFAGLITIFLEEYSGALFILAVLLINALIGAYWEYSANEAASALKKLTGLSARVRRGGTLKWINAKNLVPGDIMTLETGNKVPADLRLISIHDLNMDESLLTGESRTVAKYTKPISDKNIITSAQLNMAFAGTMVTRGRAEGVVVATGQNTHMGEIAQHISEQSRVQSPLIIRMERFTKQISIAAGLIILIVSLMLFWQGYEMEYIFLLAVGLAVAVIPEGLPVTLTIALAIGMRRMAKRNVIVRKMAAVEGLGSCTLIASDKTGTLTQNQLTVESIILPCGEEVNVSSGDGESQSDIEEKRN